MQTDSETIGEDIMDVTQRIVGYAKPRAAGLYVENICIGVGYTAVKLSDGSGGVSYTFRGELGPGCGVMRGAGRLCPVPAETVLDWAVSPNLAEAAVGIATVNALLNRGYERGPNIAQAVECEAEDTVGMVGWFCPLVNNFQAAKKLYIVERGLRQEACSGAAEARREDEEEELLPLCGKVVLTGTSFINKTADKLLAACKNASEIIIVGASTPMCPQVLKEYGVTVLAGTRIADADLALRIAAEGGGGMDLSPASVKLFERI